MESILKRWWFGGGAEEAGPLRTALRAFQPPASCFGQGQFCDVFACLQLFCFKSRSESVEKQHLRACLDRFVTQATENKTSTGSKESPEPEAAVEGQGLTIRIEWNFARILRVSWLEPDEPVDSHFFISQGKPKIPTRQLVKFLVNSWIFELLLGGVEIVSVKREICATITSSVASGCFEVGSWCQLVECKWLRNVCKWCDARSGWLKNHHFKNNRTHMHLSQSRGMPQNCDFNGDRDD